MTISFTSPNSDIAIAYSGNQSQSFNLGTVSPSFYYNNKADFGNVSSQFSYVESTGITGINDLAVNNLIGVNGTINIAASALTSLNLNSVKYVNGSITVTAPLLTTLDLSNLVYINGNITSSVSNINFPNLESSTGALVYTNTATNVSLPKLKYANTVAINCSPTTTINLPSLEYASTLTIQFYPNSSINLNSLKIGSLAFNTSYGGSNALTSLTLPNLMFGGLILRSTTTNTTLTNVSFPVLTNGISFIYIEKHDALTSFSAPLLKTSNSAITFNQNAALPTINFPALENLLGFSISNNSSLTSISFPVLNLIVGAGNGLTITNNTSLTSINLSSLVTCNANSVTITGNTNLTTISLGNLLAVNSNPINFSNNALDQATVDAILVKFAALDGTNGTTLFGSGRSINLTGGTNATPSAIGLAAKAILQARSVIVTNN